MNITANMIFFVLGLLAVSGMTVYILGEMLKRLRIRVLSLEMEIRKSRKAFVRFEKHKRKMLYQQKEAYLRLPINQREKDYPHV